MIADADKGMVYYAQRDQLYILKFVGDIRYTLSCSLDKFLDRIFSQANFDTMLIDLTETRSIDSTNLGLLAKIAKFMWRRFDKKTTLISTNPDITQLLASMGFDSVFTICSDRERCQPVDQDLTISEGTRNELADTLLESHILLSELNENNREMFKSVIEALKKD